MSKVRAFFHSLWDAGGRFWLAVPFGGALLFQQYAEFRLQHGGKLEWVPSAGGDPVMIPLPELEPWWLYWITAIAFWMILFLGLKETKRQITAPRLEFDEPIVHSMTLGPEGNPSAPRAPVNLINIRVKNHPVNMEDGRAVLQAHSSAIVSEIGGDKRKIEYLRWTQAPKPRRDETPVYLTPKFRHEMQFIDIPPNDSWLTIDFAVSDPNSSEWWGFPARAQSSSLWKLDECVFGVGKFIIEIVIQGQGLASPARKRLYLTKYEDGRIVAESIMIREALDLGAVFE